MENNRIEQFKRISPLPKSTTDALAETLDQMGFFTAPASTKYHGAYPGGLFDHCFHVWQNLTHLTRVEPFIWAEGSSEECCFLIAFLHDICKCDQYIQEVDGYYFNKNTLLKGHGEKSVMLCNLLPVKLTVEMMACIRYHMGAFCEKEEWSYFTEAIHRYPSVWWTHCADMMAAHMDEIR